MGIAVRGVSKAFDGHEVLKDVSVEVPAGELVALLGPSGCGKTTLLRIIAGLEDADRGEVLHGGTPIADRTARERNVGLVFQHYALFRHMSVFENVAFALRVRRRGRAAVRERVMELLRLVQLEGLEKRFPSQLSGGQRQRVALARALATEPKVLLLDEPFGALDARVRAELRQWLRRLHDEIHVTTLFVTHDQEEAFEVSDRVVLMNRGRVEQVGSPARVFDQPASPFVMEFLGQVNVFHGRVAGGRAHVGGVAFAAPTAGDAPSARVFVRPHELELSADALPESFAAEVRRLTPIGGQVRVELTSAAFPETLSAEVDARRAADLALAPGVLVWVAPRRVRVFEAPDSLTASAL
jgi:sulfate transport system ATP-binding protein